MCIVGPCTPHTLVTSLLSGDNGTHHDWTDLGLFTAQHAGKRAARLLVHTAPSVYHIPASRPHTHTYRAVTRYASRALSSYVYGVSPLSSVSVTSQRSHTQRRHIAPSQPGSPGGTSPSVQ